MAPVDRLIEDVKSARAEFEARLDDLDDAKERYYDAVRRLYDHGVPLRDIADAIGVSHQRVHQIVGDQQKRRQVKRRVGKHARVAGAALLVVVATSWVVSSTHPQPREDALVDLEEARAFMLRELPADARESVIPRLDKMVDQARP